MRTVPRLSAMRRDSVTDDAEPTASTTYAKPADSIRWGLLPSTWLSVSAASSSKWVPSASPVTTWWAPHATAAATWWGYRATAVTSLSGYSTRAEAMAASPMIPQPTTAIWHPGSGWRRSRPWAAMETGSWRLAA